MTKINNKISIISTFFAVLFSAGVILLQSCGIEDSSMQPKGNYISGYAMFVDTNLYHDGGYYAVGLYNKVQNAFSYNPVTVKGIDLVTQRPNPVYWRIEKGGDGDFYAAIIWVRNNSILPPIVLGTYGCDTNHTCTSYQLISFPNFTGASYNILCWNDTTNGMY